MSSSTDASQLAIDQVRLRWPENGWATVPFDRGVDHVLIEIKGACGKSYTFFADTGASLTVVTPEFVDLGDTTELSSEACAQAFGASGQIAGTPELIRIHNLLLGTLLVEEAAAVVVDLSSYTEEMGIQIHGIIGFNLLSQMTTVIDYQNSTISFSRSGPVELAEKLGAPDTGIPFELRMGSLIEVVGRVNDAPSTVFIVDIGSRYSALNQVASESSGIEFEILPGQPSALGLGEQAHITVAAGVAETLRLGDLMISEPRLYSLPLPVFSTLGLQGRNAGLLGNDLLSRYTVAIDYANKRLLLWDPQG
jgi:hypothetical protein